MQQLPRDIFVDGKFGGVCIHWQRIHRGASYLGNGNDAASGFGYRIGRHVGVDVSGLAVEDDEVSFVAMGCVGIADRGIGRQLAGILPTDYPAPKPRDRMSVWADDGGIFK